MDSRPSPANNQPSQYAWLRSAPCFNLLGSLLAGISPKTAVAHVEDPRNIGNADNALRSDLQTEGACGTEVELTRPAQHRHVDRVWQNWSGRWTVLPVAGTLKKCRRVSYQATEGGSPVHHVW